METEDAGERRPLRSAEPSSHRMPEQISMDELGLYLGMRHFHFLVLVSAIVFAVVPASIVGPVPYIIEGIEQEYGIDRALAALVISGTVIGSIFGGLTFGWLSDQVGRRVTLTLCIVVISVLASLHLALPHGNFFYRLVGLRIALGVPFGGMVVVMVPYSLEFFSDNMRGLAGTISNLGWPIGSVWSITVAEIFKHEWRTTLAIAPLLACVMSLALLVFMPESPRWLLVVGYQAEGHRALNRIFASSPVYGHAYVGAAPRIVSASGDPEYKRDSFFQQFLQLFSPGLRFMTIMACVLFVCTATASYSAWSWGPQIIQGVTGADRVADGVFIAVEVVGACGTLVTSACIDRVGRRTVMFASYTLGALAFGLLSLRPSLTTTIMIWMVVGFVQGTMWSSLSVWMAEIFPTVLRGTGSGLASFFARIANVLAPIAVGYLLPISIVATTLVIMMFYSAGFGAVCLLKEETAQIALADRLAESKKDVSA